MNGSSLKYLIKEGFRNTWTNRMMSIASICVLMSCLVIIGSASMVFLNINSLVEDMSGKNVIMVFVEDKYSEAEEESQSTDDTATTDDADNQEVVLTAEQEEAQRKEKNNALKTEIEALDNVEKAEFVPKEEAWAEQLETMDDAAASYFGTVSDDIVLPDAFKVTVKSQDTAVFKQTVESIKQMDNVYKVRDNTELANKLDTISHGVSVIAIVMIAVLFAISLFIISNTIKLTVYSRRLEISIMKSVGATNSFVRLPFVVEGMILGIVSGCVSLGLVWGVYQLATTQFKDIFSSIGLTPLNFTNYALYMLLAFIAIGIISGVCGSLITMRKYLNKEGSEISAI
jgi:cell division transport system permease protein